MRYKLLFVIPLITLASSVQAAIGGAGAIFGALIGCALGNVVGKSAGQRMTVDVMQLQLKSLPQNATKIMKNIQERSFILEKFVEAMRLWMIFLLIVFWSTNLRAQSLALPGMVQITTEEGCQAYVPEIPKYLLDSMKFSYQWSGACVGGLAQGRGVLTILNKDNFAQSSESSQTSLHAGYPIGYRKTVTQSEYLEATSIFGPEAGKPKRVTQTQTFFTFAYGNKAVNVTNVGLQISEPILSSGKVSLPTEGVKNMMTTGSIGFQGVETYVQAMLPCKFYVGKVPEFEGCKEGSAEGDITIPVLLHTKITAGSRDNKQLFCPNPKIFNPACAEKFYAQTASLRKEVIDFIALSKSSVETILQRMNLESLK